MHFRWIWGPLSGFGLAFALIAFAADQVHKYWMLHVYRIAERGKVEVASFLDVVMMWNPGISYGLLPQHGALGRNLLILFSILAAFALTFWLARAASYLGAISLGLIIGGALGNTADRIMHGAVADFFQFHIGNFSWYVFNLADVAIVAGVTGLLAEAVLVGHKNVAKVP